MKSFCGLLIMLLCLVGTTGAQRASNRRLVENVKNKVVDGCGCYFKFRGTNRSSEQYMYSQSIDQKAWMNIDNQNVQLKMLKERSPGDRERIGSRWTRTFSAGNITVSSTWVTTRMCAPDDENCESTDYDATFVVRKGMRTETVRAFGWCGC